MDSLLDKLRQNMAELSVQGDDFTRQIWQMYATFEEFVDTRSTRSSEHATSWPNEPSELRRASQHEVQSEPQAVFFDENVANKTADKMADEMLRCSRSVDAWEPTREVHPRAHRQVRARPASIEVESRSECRSPLSHSLERRSRDGRGRERVRSFTGRRRRHVANPLLETVSAIHDIHTGLQGLPGLQGPAGELSDWSPPTRERRLSASRFFSDGERDSSGYAGSNSIDSGYKSSCPTPEPTELFYSSQHRVLGPRRVESVESLVSTLRPRIAMGTQVMNRLPRGGRDRDLDELIFLRQSILTAMQRYEEPSAVAAPAPADDPDDARLKQRSHKKHRVPHRVRRLHRDAQRDSLFRGSMHGDFSSSSSSSGDSSPRSPGRLPPPNRQPLNRQPPNRQPPDGRFSEVAQCMLDIIEDLQSSSPARPPTQPSEQSLGSEQHLYEEIVYEGAGAARAPPPLPARPTTIFRCKKHPPPTPSPQLPATPPAPHGALEHQIDEYGFIREQ